MKKDTDNKIAIARLEEQVKTIRTNDLVHIQGDISEMKADIKEAHNKIDELTIKITKIITIGSIIWLAIQILIAYFFHTK